MRRLVELAAATLPWAIRDRYREEWLHDLAHADEAGVRHGDIAWGAVRTAITVDRLQAPSTAHAILQARARIDSAGVLASIAIMLALLASSSWATGVVAVSGLLATGALLHSVLLVVRLQLATAIVGGWVRFAAPLWALGAAIAVCIGLLASAGQLDGSWSWLLVTACIVASVTCAEVGKPPKPELHERVRPERRRRVLATGAAIGLVTVVLTLLDALVLVPLRWVPNVPLDAAWGTIGAASGGSPASTALLLVPLLLVPVSVGLLGAARWARSERGVLGWAAWGSAAAAASAHLHGIVAAGAFGGAAGDSSPATVLLPLVLGALIHVTTLAQHGLTPLPPASVPIPPGPWHVQLQLPTHAKGPGVEPRADRARGGT